MHVSSPVPRSPVHGPAAGAALMAMGVVAVSLLAVGAAGAREVPWQPPDCAADAAGLRAVAATAAPPGPEALAGEAWFRLDPRLDEAGTLAGQRLHLGRQGQPGARFVDLPPEASAAGPFGPLVLVTADDGVRSRIDGYDAVAGCRHPIAETAAVVRRATLVPSAGAVYEFRVDRRTRADLGVWRRELLAPNGATRVVGPLPDDDRFGPTFSTELAWAGDRLVVESCGAVACRIRVADLASGTVRTHDDPRVGHLVGVTPDGVVAHGACPGLPCPIVVLGEAPGEVRTLVREAGAARLVTTADGSLVVHEDGRGRPRLGVVDPRAPNTAVTIPIPRGLRLIPTHGPTGARLRLPEGWVLLAPDGLAERGGAAEPSWLVSVPDGRRAELTEVPR